MDLGTTDRADRPSLLVLDAAYTLEMIRERGLESSITCRDLDGYFAHVFSVHPFATLLTSPEWGKRFGPPQWYRLNEGHSVIEGRIGRFGWLGWLFPLNFMIAQAGLFVMLVRLIRRERVAAIRVGDPLYLGLFGLALKAVTGRPLLIRVNGNNDKVRESTGRPLYPRFFRSIALEQKIEKFVFPRADVVAAPNQDNVDFALARGAKAGCTTIFRYGNLLAPDHRQPPEERGLDRELFARLGIEPGEFMLLVGRLQAVKFPDDAVRVLAEVVGRGHDVKLFIAGDGDMRSELINLADSLGVQGRLVIGGYQNQHALAQLNAHCALVISPLTGRALSESALGGAPIVAYDLDWQGDLVRNGETGALVPFRDIAALTDATAAMLDSPQRASELGEAARLRALAMLDPEVLNAHERDTYVRLLAGEPPQPGC
ncbi:MAG: glycosyltransferase [Pseudomonadota bacterium]|nr:glycosyltransferase [Pseudomonadota bacterium]